MTALPIFFALRKVDEEKRLVSGIATAEVLDKSGEVCDYESTKPYYQKWSDGFKKATNGKSLGNVRIMHQPEVAGKLTDIQFNDAEKSIEITAKIVDDNCWKMVLDGCYSGFSQGGEYVDKWQEGDVTHYTANPAEVSIVDNPCVTEATFEIVKADGAVEMRKFHTKEDAKPEVNKDEPKVPSNKTDPEVTQGWQAKDGSFHKSKADALKHNQAVEAQALVKAATAEVDKLLGDINEKIDSKIESDIYWKRDFSDDERSKMAESGEAMEDGSFPIKSEQDLKNAIRAVGRAKDPAKAKDHIKTRAKALGLESLVPDDWKMAKRSGLKITKDLHTVARAACLAQELEWLQQCVAAEEAWEEDKDSDAPDHLTSIIKEVLAFLVTYTEEECSEIVEDHGGTGIEAALEAAAGMPVHHARAIGKHLKAGKLLDAVKKVSEPGDGSADGEKPHADRVKAIHKAAGRVMQHCMKAMHEMHDDGEVTKAVPEASDHVKKAHAAGNEIMQHCMKMGSKIEPDEADAEKAMHSEELAKSQAMNTALTKTITGLTGKLQEVLKRVDHLERKPAVLKGMPFDVTGHEAQSGTAPVETNSNPYEALRLSPEHERRLAHNAR